MYLATDCYQNHQLLSVNIDVLCLMSGSWLVPFSC